MIMKWHRSDNIEKHIDSRFENGNLDPSLVRLKAISTSHFARPATNCSSYAVQPSGADSSSGQDK